METETEKLAASEARAVDDKHPKINNRTTDRGAVFSRTERQRRALDAASDYFPHTHTHAHRNTHRHTLIRMHLALAQWAADAETFGNTAQKV